MRYFLLISIIPVVVFAAKEKTNEKMLQKIKSGDNNITVEGYLIQPNDKALLEMIEELEERIEVLENKLK